MSLLLWIFQEYTNGIFRHWKENLDLIGVLKLEGRMAVGNLGTRYTTDRIDKATYLDVCCPQFCNNLHALHQKSTPSSTAHQDFHSCFLFPGRAKILWSELSEHNISTNGTYDIQGWAFTHNSCKLWKNYKLFYHIEENWTSKSRAQDANSPNHRLRLHFDLLIFVRWRDHLSAVAA